MCALVWLIFVFGELPVTVSKLKSFQVFVQFQSAPGVQKETPVRFCGYQIGRVTKVKPPEKCRDLNSGLEYHQAVVVLSIDKEYVNIPSNVEVKLMTRGLGSSYIELVVDPSLPPAPLDPNRPVTTFLTDGMLLQGSTGMTSEFFPEASQKKLEELVDDLNTLVRNADDVIGDQDNKDNLKALLANMAKVSSSAVGAAERLDKLFSTATDTSHQLGETLVEMRLVLEKINAGDGTAAKFVNDGRLYEALLENTRQLKSLLEEVERLVARSREKGIPIKLK
jgi:ABC-type transporter Mla subunit MlaD